MLLFFGNNPHFADVIDVTSNFEKSSLEDFYQSNLLGLN